jgi:hypothetical protein
LKIFRNMRKIALKKWIIEEIMKVLNRAIQHRLQNLEREIRKELTLINEDWTKLTIEVFKSFNVLTHSEISITMSFLISSFILSFLNSILFNENLNYIFINFQIFHESTRLFKLMNSLSRRSFSFYTLRTTV